MILLLLPTAVAAVAATAATKLALAVAPSAPPSPAGWDPQLYCEAKRHALRYAQSLLLQRGALPELHDSLQLSSACGEPEPGRLPSAAPPRMPPPTPPSTPLRKTIYVSVNGSDDTGTGTAAQPLRTLQRATSLLRVARACPTCGGPGTILLSRGTHYMENVLHLEPNDSGLTIRAMPGVKPEECVLSGGRVLANLTWLPSERGGGVMKAQIGVGARFSTLFKPNGRRAIRGRHPNANPETQGLWTPHTRTGYNNAVNMSAFPQETRKQTCSPRMTPGGDGISIPDFIYGNYSCGRNQATASGFTDIPFTSHPFVEFWCGAWSAHTRVAVAADALPPSGLGKYNSLEGAEPIFTLTKGSSDIWANFQFVVSGAARHGATVSSPPPGPATRPPSSSPGSGAGVGPGEIELNFSSGGQQGPWGSSARTGWWFVENALGLVDEPGEWWVDSTDGWLHYFPNSTHDLSQPLIATALESLIEIRGTRARAVEDINIFGVTLAHTEVHYTQLYESQGGGGISMHRGGALVVEGAVGVTVDSCVFDGIGGHGVLLSNYVRYAKVTNSEFKWIGDTAIVSMGSTSMFDATEENYPVGNQITSNYIHEVGIYAKQGAGYFQSKTARTNISGNVIFGGPRAGIELTDAMVGGHVVQNNLLVDLCRETTDHGPISESNPHCCVLAQHFAAARVTLMTELDADHDRKRRHVGEGSIYSAVRHKARPF